MWKFALSISLFYTVSSATGYAQDRPAVKFGEISAKDFVLPASSAIVGDPGAVILSETGSMSFVGNNRGSSSCMYKKHVRIKINDQKGMALATVKLRLYRPKREPDGIEFLAGATYNLSDGKVITIQLESKDILEDRENADFVIKKFTFPGVKEGSIIEYTYAINYGWDFDLPDWTFQSSHYPCLWSEFRMAIPENLAYIIIRHGFHDFAIDKASKEVDDFMVTTQATKGAIGTAWQKQASSARTLIHRWVMKDIPPFNAEAFISTPENYLDRIEFQLRRYYVRGNWYDVGASWQKTNTSFMNRSDFGLPIIEQEGWIKDLADKITAGINLPLDKAKALYYYVTGHLTCTNYDASVITTDLSDVVNKNNGSVADINIFLAAMLRREGFDANPVLLSTRSNGYFLSGYPDASKMNYVVVRLKMLGKFFYLDASVSKMGFGQLPDYCYNGYARIISDKDTGSVFLWADALKEKKTTSFIISSTEKGLEGVCQKTLGPQESYDVRVSVGEKGLPEYGKAIQDSYGEGYVISNVNVDSLQQPEFPLQVRYDLLMKDFGGSSLVYLNPLMTGAWKENPFKATERKYPVEMSYPVDETYLFSMEVPEGYTVDELPKSARVAFNGDQGLFEYLIQQQDGRIQLRCHVMLNKAIFAADDYGSLRDFFAYIVKKESEQIVLKKK